MTKVANPDRYIWPPRPDAAIPREETSFLKNTTWIAQLKYNDSRCLIKYLPDGSIELWNRHGEQFRSYHAPEWLLDQLHGVKVDLGLHANKYHLLDGGLLDAKHRAIKDTIVIWDALVLNDEYLTGTTYAQRYNELFEQLFRAKDHDGTHSRAAEEQGLPKPWFYSHESYERPYMFGYTLHKNIFFPANYASPHWPGLWDDIHAVNKPFLDQEIGPLLEGLVFKNLTGKLKTAFREKNNNHWIMRSRVTTGRHAF